MRYDLPFAHPIQSNPTGCLASSSDKIQCNTAATKIGNPFCIIVYIAIWRNHETERAENSIKYFLIEPTKSKKGVLIERIEKERKKRFDYMILIQFDDEQSETFRRTTETQTQCAIELINSTIFQFAKQRHVDKKKGMTKQVKRGKFHRIGIRNAPYKSQTYIC